MKKLLFAFAIIASFAVGFSNDAHAQNLTTVSASNITDINGTRLAAGQLCFLITDQQDNPISVSIGGGGQALRRGYCSAVAAGVVTSFTVPTPAATSPAGIYYRVTVKDSSTGQEVLRYTGVTFAGATFNFDNYAPVNLGSFAPLTGNSVSGNLSVTGNVAATGTVTGSNIPSSILQQIFSSGVGQTQRTAFNMMAGLTCSDNAGTSRTDCRLGTLTTVTFSATPTFDASTASTFKLTLTGNVTSSTLSNAVAGEPLAFEICQDATGGRTFVAPATVQGFLPISSTANACSLEVFYFDGTNAQPDLLAGLIGDVNSNPGSAATTVVKVNGVSFPSSPSTHAVPVVTAANTVTWKVVPDCTDTTGNHINYTQSTDVWSCGTSTPAGAVTASSTTTFTNKSIGAGGLAGLSLNKQIFTSSGTHTIAAGVTAEKVTVCGGGGAGGGATASNNGGGGGAGGCSTKWLTGLTPGNTLTVTIGGGGAGSAGAAGGSGTLSTVASGTQTIGTITGGGASGGNANGTQSAGGAGGTASGGDLNFGGNPGGGAYTTITGGPGGGSIFGGGAADSNGGNPGNSASANTGAGGGGAGAGASRAGGNGGSGIIIFEWTN
jgi:hypothetical protein